MTKISIKNDNNIDLNDNNIDFNKPYFPKKTTCTTVMDFYYTYTHR